MPTPLSLLAIKYDCDKWGAKHSYTDWYYETFKDRAATVRKVVEIGVGEGRSLRMWRDFFPNAHIYGMDVAAARVFQDERITVYKGNQHSVHDLRGLVDKVGSDVDLFIDDASHRPPDQAFTARTIMPLLGKGATYVIEDVAVLLDPATFDGYDWHEPQLEHRRRHDNRLIVVRHK